MDAMVARYLISFPCQDACGTVETGERVGGAPVYRCPGCDSEWFELNERTPQPPAPSPGVAAPDGTASR